MTGIKRVLDEYVGERGELARERGVIPLFALVASQIFQHEDVSRRERADGRARPHSDGLRAESNLPAGRQAPQCFSDRRKRLGSLLADVAYERYPRAALA